MAKGELSGLVYATYERAVLLNKPFNIADA